MALDALQLLAANALFFLAGLGVLRLFGWRRTSRLGGAALAYLAGVAALGVIAPLLLVAGAALTSWQVVLVAALLFAAGFLRPAVDADEADPAPRELVVPAAALLAALFCLLAVDLWFQPLFAWDAWSHWTPKARAIVLMDGLDASLFSAPRYSIWNPDYPILLPALEAIDFRFMGFNTRILHLQFGLLLGAFALALAEASGRRVPRLVVWPVLLATLWAPGLLIQTASAYADVPLGIVVALAGVCAWRWLAEEEPAALAALGLFVAAALATKMEGQVFAAGVVAALAGVLAFTAPRRLLPLGATAAAAALVSIVPWRLWTLAHDAHGAYSSEELLSRLSDPGRLADTAGRMPIAAARLAGEAVDPRSWLVIVPLAVVSGALALRFGRRDTVLFAVGAIGLAFVGLVVIYWLTPFPFEWHLDRSASRVVTPPVLLAAALTPVLLAEALGTTRVRPE
jgi:hypothetical protein